MFKPLYVLYYRMHWNINVRSCAYMKFVFAIIYICNNTKNDLTHAQTNTCICIWLHTCKYTHTHAFFYTCPCLKYIHLTNLNLFTQHVTMKNVITYIFIIRKECNMLWQTNMYFSTKTKCIAVQKNALIDVLKQQLCQKCLL